MNNIFSSAYSSATGLATGAPAASIGNTLSIKPQRSLGGVYFDVVLEESHEDTLKVTDNPVEEGRSISDHAFKEPCQVSISAGVSASGEAGGAGTRAGASSGANAGRPLEMYEKLLALQKSCEPFDIYTGKRKYSNMLVTSLSVTTSPESENCLMLRASCTEVITVKSRSGIVPPNKRHQNPSVTGMPVNKGQVQLLFQ